MSAAEIEPRVFLFDPEAAMNLRTGCMVSGTLVVGLLLQEPLRIAMKSSGVGLTIGGMICIGNLMALVWIIFRLPRYLLVLDASGLTARSIPLGSTKAAARRLVAFAESPALAAQTGRRLWSFPWSELDHVRIRAAGEDNQALWLELVAAEHRRTMLLVGPKSGGMPEYRALLAAFRRRGYGPELGEGLTP